MNPSNNNSLFSLSDDPGVGDIPDFDLVDENGIDLSADIDDIDMELSEMIDDDVMDIIGIDSSGFEFFS